jgi:uncharacterized protein (DUF924 family)
MYMPFMHSEQLEDQKKCVVLNAAAGNDYTAKYGQEHADIIVRFGRFPHRNKILGRESTEEEQAFLTQPGSSF